MILSGNKQYVFEFIIMATAFVCVLHGEVCYLYLRMEMEKNGV